MNRSVSDKFKAELNDAAAAIQAINKIAHELHQGSEAQRVLLEDFEMKLGVVRRMAGTQVPSLRSLDGRINRMKELRNIQEFGAFTITVEKEMQKAWEALP